MKGAGILCSKGDDVQSLHSWSPITEAIRRLAGPPERTRWRQRHLPVVRDGALCGMVSIGDVVRHRLEEMRLEADVLRDMDRAHR